MKVIRSIVLMCLVGLLPTAAVGQTIVWTDQYARRIQCKDVNGGEVGTIVQFPFPNTPSVIHYDPIAAKLYYLFFAGGTTVFFQRANLDGSNPENIPTPSVGNFTLNVESRKLYWLSRDSGRSVLYLSELNGSGVESHTYPSCCLFALEALGEDLFFCAGGIMLKGIWRADADGSNEQFLHGSGESTDMAHDPLENKLYLADIAGIVRLNPDGSGFQEIVHLPDTGVDQVVVDSRGRKLYWVVNYAKVIRRSNLDGSNVEVFVTASDVGNPNFDIRGLTIVYSFTPLPEPNGGKGRALSFRVPPGAAAGPLQTAIRFTMVTLQDPDPPNVANYPPPDFSAYESATCSAGGETNGCARWVGKPGTFLESQEDATLGSFKSARLQCTPYYHDFTSEGLLHVVGAEVLPSSRYDVLVFGSSCKGGESTCTDVSTVVAMTTRRSGDIAANFNPPSTTDQPDALDIAQVVNKLKSVPGSLVKSITQSQPNLPELNADVNALDIAAVVDAVKQFAYAFSGPCPCPSTVMCGSTACTTPTICASTFGAESTCVKTCTGGDNDGDPCINDTHCPGGACGEGFCRDRCGRCTP